MSRAEVDAVIDRIKEIEFVPRLKSVSGSYLFDVEGAGSWRLDVDHGRVAVGEATGSADCVIRAGAEDFVRIMTGAQNLVTAWMQGLVEVEGDPSLAQKLHGVLPRKQREES
jgi:putative sterol carrier protein